MTDISLSVLHSTQCSSRCEFLICPLMLQKCAFRYFWPSWPRAGLVGTGLTLLHGSAAVAGQGSIGAGWNPVNNQKPRSAVQTSKSRGIKEPFTGDGTCLE